MNKIFIVTQGDYSDYRIIGVFSTEENANGFIALTSGYNMEVEEYNIDELLESFNPLRFNTAYYVQMQRDGDVLSVGVEDEVWALQKALKCEYDVGRNKLCMYVIAKTKQHAVKIVNEKRVQLISGVGWDREMR